MENRSTFCKREKIQQVLQQYLLRQLLVWAKMENRKMVQRVKAFKRNQELFDLLLSKLQQQQLIQALRICH
mgnify:CR=1 FL=1